MTQKQLLSVIKSPLLGPLPSSPSQRVELMHAIRASLPSLQSLLSYPTPKAANRAEAQSKQVKTRNASQILLDDQDVQIALKLSADLHLNEIDCVRLIISANQEWGLLGREPLDIVRLATWIWYTESRDLLTALFTLLRAVVLDLGLDADVVSDIHKYIENLIKNGLRQRLISLIKELNREELDGLGGPHSEPYVLDSRAPKDVKDIFLIYKDNTSELSGNTDTINGQSCLKAVFPKNVFRFILDEVLKAATYEDISYMYSAYLHKLMICFLSHPIARDKVKEYKEGYELVQILELLEEQILGLSTK